MSDIFASENGNPVKSKFIELLQSVKREGIPDLLNWLTNNTDFFTAPASTKHHGAHDGGLCEHSLTVYENLQKLLTAFGAPIGQSCTVDGMIITALLHDICKVNFYQKVIKSKKDGFHPNGKIKWVDAVGYDIDDQFPAGHGEKSVIILQKFIELTDEEIMAINWHMGFSDDRCKGYGGMQAISNAFGKYPLAVALHMADLASNYFDGV